MGSCLKRKEALKLPTHSRALLALLPVFQLTLREGEKERSQKHRDKEKGKGDSHFDRICNSISRLRIVIEGEAQV